jgi:hypothetical protein
MLVDLKISGDFFEKKNSAKFSEEVSNEEVEG